MDDFKVVESKRLPKKKNDAADIEIIEVKQKGGANFLVDNADNIFGLAKDVAEMFKMQVQSDAIIEKMKQDRKMIIAEAEAYVACKEADTNKSVRKLEMLSKILDGYYKNGSDKMSAEEFAKLIVPILSKEFNYHV